MRACIHARARAYVCTRAGGYSQKITVDENYVLRIPDSIELARAGLFSQFVGVRARNKKGGGISNEAYLLEVTTAACRESCCCAPASRGIHLSTCVCCARGACGCVPKKKLLA